MLCIKKILLVLLAFSNITCLGSDDKLSLGKNENFPQWIKSNNIFTNQTSGIAFIANNNNSYMFLLADDIGDLYYLNVADDKISNLKKISFSPVVNEYLRKFPKKDFEDIYYDKSEQKLYVSIEGNGKNYKDYVGIYLLEFNNNDITSGLITGISKVNIQPEDEFLRYTSTNIGYEGLAVDDKYIYLGLETSAQNPIISDNTYIFVVDKEKKNIIKKLTTKELGITSICGLYISGNKLMGIDRNNKSYFSLVLDDSFNVVSYQKIEINTSIPGYPDFDYIASLESITMDENNNIYFVDDPWKSHYVPNQEIQSKLDSGTRENFNKFIPIIYKFKLQAGS